MERNERMREATGKRIIRRRLERLLNVRRERGHTCLSIPSPNLPHSSVAAVFPRVVDNPQSGGAERRNELHIIKRW